MVFLAVVCVFIIVGNCFVLAAIRLSENGRKSRMNFFIMHLAIADLLVGVMVVIPDMATKITVEWYAGNAMCKIIQYSQTAVTYSSTYMLVSLSLDRYDAVARPMNFSRSGLQGRFLVLISWLISLAFASPTIYLYSETVREGKKQCWLEFPEVWQWQLFFTIVFVVTFLLPAIIIASCYIAIIYIIWSKGRYHEPTRESHNDTNVTHSRLIINENRHDTGRGIIPQAKIRTIKMTLIIVIVFIMCWSPFFLYNLFDLYELIPPNDSVATLFQSAAPLNSAANPIIYGIFSTRICKNLRRLPLPSFLRSLACHCQDNFCRKRSFRSRQHPYLTSQLTDPTQSTMDVHRRVDLRSHLSKRGSRLGKWTACLDDVDLIVLQEAEQKLKNSKSQNSKGAAAMGKKGGQQCWDHAVDGNYELTPLAHNEVTHRKGTSDGSDDSPQTSESNVVKGKDYIIYTEENLAFANSLPKKNDNNFFIKNNVRNPCSLESYSVNNQRLFKKNSSKDESIGICDSGYPDNRSDSALTKNNTVSNFCEIQRDDHGFNDGGQSYQDINIHFDRDASSYSHNASFSECAEVCAESDLVFADDDLNGPLENCLDRSCLATRRPSGVPSVRRRLTSDDNVVLKNATCQWASVDVSADEKSFT
ncbi:cardioacceleratory peptide receptor [Biomphalaria glabrata]